MLDLSFSPFKKKKMLKLEHYEITIYCYVDGIYEDVITYFSNDMPFKVGEIIDLTVDVRHDGEFDTNARSHIRWRVIAIKHDVDVLLGDTEKVKHSIHVIVEEVKDLNEI